MASATLPNGHHPPPADFSSATKTHTQGNFTILSRKLPISKAGPISALESRLQIPIPEMIFGDNLVSITHRPTNWSISFSAEPALALVDKTGENMLRVAHSSSWSASREQSEAMHIREVVRPFDWTYSTAYFGDERKEGEKGLEEQDPRSKQIPLELLRRRDPILFFDEVVLYESELDDNGISSLTVKLRVMEQRMLLLCRLFMRVDGVLVRVRDTRVYVDFDRDEVIREYTAKESAFEEVKRGLLMTGLRPDEIIVAMRDGNQVAPILKVVEHHVESINLAA